MSRNVEVKAKIDNFNEFLVKCEELSQSVGEIIKQEDYFYNSSNGRLKLRNIEGRKSELISYVRPDDDKPKLSEYDKCDVHNSDELNKVLSRALGVCGVVKKTRHLFLIGQTRIHVDQVTGLGSFMELEVVLSKTQTIEDGQKIANELMEKLSVNSGQLISVAYVDLLKTKFDS
ncbi:uncharacterized protein LOC142332253 [Lycorma delicatula]|uniref:uncharacterized protein LOC142332253 n=1 Tax=Lycorma delicatula TaxID=130591 RepID=UPI003F514F80